MTIKTCAAPNCEETFLPKSYQQVFCSDRCRWRVSKQQTYDSRIKEGLCPQCGCHLDKDNNSSASYCKDCQKYFRDRYYKN